MAELKKTVKLNRRINLGMAASALTVIGSLVLLAAAPALEATFDRIMSIAGFLAWHNLLEITGVIGNLAIFLVSFYTYRQEGKLKAIVLGTLLFSAGVFDVFHVLSYKGMPAFFTENLTADRATIFWIAGRLISSLAYLTAACMNDERKSKISGYYFTAAAFFISISVFAAATFLPGILPAMYIEGHGMTDIKIFLEYVIMLTTAAASFFYLRKYFMLKNPVLFTMFSALLLSIIGEFSFTIYIDVYDVYNLIGHVLKAISLFMVFNVVFSKNVLAPYKALSAAQEELREYATGLDMIVSQRTSELRRINERLIEDLDYARDIQKSMLPSFFPSTPHIGFSVLYMPAERLSGDFYDVFWLDESHIGFYVCDVSGHGVPAAMLTVFLKQCISSLIEADRSIGSVSAPSRVLTYVYDAFNQTNFKDEVYIVLIYFIYDIKANKLLFCSAGMNELPLYGNAQGQLTEIDIKGFPICKLKEFCEADYRDAEMWVNAGDRLYVYTDGLVEVRNGRNEQYTAARLRSLICASAGMEESKTELISRLRNNIQEFIGGSAADDDITLLCVEFN